MTGLTDKREDLLKKIQLYQERERMYRKIEQERKVREDTASEKAKKQLNLIEVLKNKILSRRREKASRRARR